jgi:hypothetical protein
MRIEQPLVLRPHHVETIIAWLIAPPPERPLLEQPEKLEHYFGNDAKKFAQFFRYLATHREAHVVVLDGPDFICKRLCSYYNPKTNSCSKYYEGEDTFVPAEEYRVRGDSISSSVCDYKHIKTIEDLLQKKHWKL